MKRSDLVQFSELNKLLTGFEAALAGLREAEVRANLHVFNGSNVKEVKINRTEALICILTAEIDDIWEKLEKLGVERSNVVKEK